jgi:hypothetical protein
MGRWRKETPDPCNSDLPCLPRETQTWIFDSISSQMVTGPSGESSRALTEAQLAQEREAERLRKAKR